MCVVLPRTAGAGEQRSIKVHLDEWETIFRSLSDAPLLSYDGSTVYIYSRLPLQNMEVTVTDVSGDMVYTGILSVGAGQTISFTFEDTGSEMYRIEVTHGAKYLYGWFEME